MGSSGEPPWIVRLEDDDRVRTGLPDDLRGAIEEEYGDKMSRRRLEAHLEGFYVLLYGLVFAVALVAQIRIDPPDGWWWVGAVLIYGIVAVPFGLLLWTLGFYIGNSIYDSRWRAFLRRHRGQRTLWERLRGRLPYSDHGDDLDDWL